MAATVAERRSVHKVLAILGVIATVALLIASGLAFYGYRFATNYVRDELAAQKIYFPAADSPALADFPELQKYGGQLVDDGPKAKAYTDYIAGHLKNTADGKTYAEVSTLARQNPDNQQLQDQRTSLFQGETLRGLLLGNGYGYWTIGMIALYVSIATLALAGATALGTLYCAARLKRLK